RSRAWCGWKSDPKARRYAPGLLVSQPIPWRLRILFVVEPVENRLFLVCCLSQGLSRILPLQENTVRHVDRDLALSLLIDEDRRVSIFKPLQKRSVDRIREIVLGQGRSLARGKLTHDF